MSYVHQATSATTSLPLVEDRERLLRPVKRRLRFRELIREAPVIRVLAARDFKVKYKQSLLGPLWLFFQPLALLVAFLVAFVGLVGVETDGVPYVAFALAGLTVWTFFQASLTIGTASLISNYHLVRLTPCPRPAFPIASVIASLPALAVTAVGAIVAAVIAGALPLRVLLLPVAVLWLLVFTAGVVAISSAVAVLFRDVLNGLPFLLQVGVFVTPVGYPTDELSPTVRTLVELNPLTGIIETFRWLLLDVASPDLLPLAASLLATVGVTVGGWLFFSRLEVVMADRI